MTTLELLEDKLGTGELIRIKYHGGTKPGTVRDIVPTKIDQKKKLLIAYCCETRQGGKSYSIDKIEILDNKKPNDVEYKDYKQLSLEELYLQHKEKWEKIGWYIEYDKCFIRLYKRNKRTGQPLKYPLVYIHDMEGNNLSWLERFIAFFRSDKKQNKRRWYVFGNKQESSFSNYQKAITKFLEYSEIIS